MADKPYLLSDDEIISFIIHGSHIVEPDFPEGFNESIYAELEEEKLCQPPLKQLIDGLTRHAPS